MVSRCNNNCIKSHQGGTVKALGPNLILLPIELGMTCESREALKSIRVSKNLQWFFGVDNLYLYRHSECFCLKCGLCSDILHRPCLVQPCGHLFCEPCLRRAKINECSTCKTKIDDCKSHQGMYLLYLLYQNPLLNRTGSFIKFTVKGAVHEGPHHFFPVF